MEKSNQRKRVGRKSSIEKIYLSGEELIEIIEVSKKLGNYPICSVFSYEHLLNFIYRFYNNYRWKLELRLVNEKKELFEYSISTTTRNNRIYNKLIVIELEEKFVSKLIEDLNT